MADLADSVESLKRAVAVPGAFAAAFPSTTDDDLAFTLADAFAECQLYGFLSDHDVSNDTVISPDLTTGGLALVVLFAATRILENELGNRKTHVRYEAGSTVFEQDQGSQMLAQRLKDLSDRKKDLLARADQANYDTSTFTADLYFVKAVSDYGFGSLSTPLSDRDAFGVG